jgi:hypothetical protein
MECTLECGACCRFLWRQFAGAKPRLVAGLKHVYDLYDRRNSMDLRKKKKLIERGYNEAARF